MSASWKLASPSAASRQLRSSASKDSPGSLIAAHRNPSAWGDGRVAVVAADDLAGRCWDMYLKQDRAEEEVTPGLGTSSDS